MIEKYVKPIILIPLIYMVFFSIPFLYGQQPQVQQRQAEGIDLILVLDQSGSMGGHGKHPIPNDPENKRNQLLDNILRYIIDSAYRGGVYRISVIEFGSRNGSRPKWRPAVTLDKYKIEKPNTGESESAYRQRVKLDFQYLKKDRTRGDSDHGAAMKLVEKEIAALKKTIVPPPIGQSGTLRRLIVTFLLTDGRPYVVEKESNVIPTAQLKKEIQGIVKKFPTRDSILYVFGLNDVDNYWDTGDGNFWDMVAASTVNDKQERGYAQKLDNDKEMLEQILPVITKYTNPPGLKIIYGDSFDCPPYLKSIQFTVEFPRSFMRVPQALDIFQPGGIPLSTANAMEKKVSATIDVFAPAAGVWRFKRKDKDVKLMVMQKYESVTFLSPVSPVHMRSSHFIRFKVSGSGIVLNPQYPLQPTITIRTPTGKIDILNAPLDPNDSRIFISKTKYLFQDPGEYDIEFKASVTSVAGSPVIVLQASGQKVQVSNSTPLEMVMEEPGKVSSSFARIKQSFRFGFYKDNGKTKVPLQDMLNTNKKIKAYAEVFDTASGLLIRKGDFHLSQENGSLGGKVDLDLPWMELVKILLGKRKVKVTVEFDQRHVKGSYFLVVPQTQTRLYEFDRPLEEGILTYIALIAALLLLFAIIALPLILLKMRTCSQEVPVLVFKQESELFAVEGSSRSIVVDKKIIKKKSGEFQFLIPDSIETWKPELIIKRQCIDQGVSISLEYEKFGKTRADKKNLFEKILEKLKLKKVDPDKERMRKATLQKPYPNISSIHRIEEFKDSGMVFELQIKGKENT